MRGFLLGWATLAGLSPSMAFGQPKVAVVVAGDPEPALVTEAVRIESIIAACSDLMLPTDPALRAALRGEPATELDDGLESARAERRRLGWGSEAEDAAILVRLGHAVSAPILVVVSRNADAIEASSFNVEARAFYERTLRVTEISDEEIAEYIRRRAHSPVAADAPDATAFDARGSNPREFDARGSNPRAIEPETDEPTTPQRERWIARAWPYFVAAALLAGAVTFVVLTRDDDPAVGTVLRFRPGGQ